MMPALQLDMGDPEDGVLETSEEWFARERPGEYTQQ